MLVACFLIPSIGVACERARLPHLWGEPVALAGADGCLSVVSDEAAKFGIKPGQAATGARAFCPHIIILPYDREAYEDAVSCVWDLLALESSVVEPISPEICFMEITGSDIVERARELAHHIACRVRVNVQVGLATSKMVAQQAAQRADPAQVLTVEIGCEAVFLANLPLSRLPKLNKKMIQKLERLGVQTLGDVLRLPPRELNRQFKQVGPLLRRLALGEDGDRVRASWPPRALEESWMFEDEVVHSQFVELALKECAGRIARELVANREFARSLALRVVMADRTQTDAKEKLSQPADDADVLFCAALRLLRRTRIDQPIVELHLKASDLGAGSGLQLTLLDEHGNGLPHERRQRLEATLAYLRRRYGFGVVITAALLHQARRIHLWAAPMTRLANESVEVVTTTHGTPARFYRRGKRYEVTAIQNRWKETDWLFGRVVDKTAYRILTEPSGLYELHKVGVQWRLGGVAD